MERELGLVFSCGRIKMRILMSWFRRQGMTSLVKADGTNMPPENPNPCRTGAE